MDDNWQLEDPCPYPSTEWFISDPTSDLFPEGYVSCDRPKARDSAPCKACLCRQSRIRHPSDVKGFPFILCLDATSKTDCTQQLGTPCTENGTVVGAKPTSTPTPTPVPKAARVTEMAAALTPSPTTAAPTTATHTTQPVGTAPSTNSTNTTPISVSISSGHKHSVFTTPLIVAIVVGSVIVLATLVFIICTLHKDKRRESKTLRVSALDAQTTTHKEPEGEWLTAWSPGVASASVASSSAQTQVANFRGLGTQGICLYRVSSPVPPLRRTLPGSPVIMENEVFLTDRSGDSSARTLDDDAQINPEMLSQITFSSTFLSSPAAQEPAATARLGSEFIDQVDSSEGRPPVAPIQVALASSVGSRGSYESHYTARSAVVFEADEEEAPSSRV